MQSFHNAHFKAPRVPEYPQRSPSPPHAYIEPLSPSSARPRPVEPSFYYPATQSHDQYGAGSTFNGARVGQDRKRGHHRATSSIDALADAALASDVSYRATHARQYGEPLHKRARSDAYHPAFDMSVQSTSRPITSHHGYGMPYETRVEDAALLLNFSTTGGKAVIQHYRPHANSLPTQPPANPYAYRYAPYKSQYYPQPTLPSPQRTSEGKGSTPDKEDSVVEDGQLHMKRIFTHQTHTPPEEEIQTVKVAIELLPKKRGWPKGKPRGASTRKVTPVVTTEKVKRQAPQRQAIRKKKGLKKAEQLAMQHTKRRSSMSALNTVTRMPQDQPRSRSVPRDINMIILPQTAKSSRRAAKTKDITICAGCNDQRTSPIGSGELDEWISCNGCRRWYHLDCAGFKRAVEVRDVDKYFCTGCEAKHGKTTYVRKSARAHSSVDYAELQKGVLKTSEESNEHHYIQPIKDGTFSFDQDQFPRMRPELLTRDFFERSGAFVEPICIPAEWNDRPWAVGSESASDSINQNEYEYDCVLDEGQDKLDMVMPKGLTVRKVCHLVGPDTPLDVIDVKTQNSGAKWNLNKWADYYESNADDKPIRNVISLEVSKTKLGRLLRRPKVVRDIDLQDLVWPKEETEKGKWPKVQYYCLMSIADSYTDFHIDFGGSSVYYHLIKGKKTFFFIPPKAKHLKAYEEWNDNPQQNFTFLPHITKECYRVDLSEGDTMLIPSGWIHAVWTPETSLVIGGNFLTHMNFKNQFKVAEIEKNNETPLKFRYPFFQRLMWYTAIHYMQTDPMPEEVRQMFLEGSQYDREFPIWQDYDNEESDRVGSSNARYYGQAEVDGLPDLANFIFRTVMMTLGRIEGITADRMKRVHASIPKGYGEPLDIAKAFGLWVAWKRGNEDPPAWSHPDAILPSNSKDEGSPKKLSARAIKDLERKEAFAARQGTSRSSKRVQQHETPAPLSTLTTPLPTAPPATTISASATSSVIPPLSSAASATIPITPSISTTSTDIPISASMMMSSVTSVAQTERSAIDATTTHLEDATLNFNYANAMHATSSSSLSSPHMFYSSSVHQDSVFTPSYDYSPPSTAPTTMMMSAFQGQHISTPKTSVLGPKRVACDACRRRRIRCKHKDFVVQAVPDMHQFSGGFDTIGASAEDGDDLMISDHQHDEYHEENTHDETVNGLVQQNAPQHYIKMENPTRPSNGNLSAIPGTNAYVDANIPMTLNGVALFGDVKRGRSKACFECRKSKRRCIHDEQGNVDPVKAAETPIPRASPAIKKRLSEDNLTNDTKKTKITPQQQGVLGVLKPANYKRQSPIHSEWSSASPISDHMVHTPIDGSTPNSHASMPIDPSLTSAYPDPSHDAYSAHYSYTRPPMASLPSLEEIATEVLDMDGGEPDLAAVIQFNQLGDISNQIMPTTTTETAHTVTENRPRQGSITNIPMYKPPASKSPELTRAALHSSPKRAAITSPVKTHHTRTVSKDCIKDENSTS